VRRSTPCKKLLVAAVLTLASAAGARSQDDPLAELSARGRELMAAGRYAEAVPVYRQLSDKAPESPGLLLNLGMALHLSGASREALAPLAEAAKRDPASYPAALMLGAARLRCGEPRAAMAPLKAAVRLRPDESEARSLLADALLAQGRHAEAGPQLEALARLAPEDASAWLRLGRSYEALATRGFETLLERGPESAYMLALVAEVRRDEGRADAALELYRKASERAPGMRGLHAAAAELEREAGRADRAAAEEALERGLPKPDCAQKTLECRFAAGRHREVVAAAATATTPAAAYWLARSSNELAREAFARLEKLPPSAALHEWRAEQLRGEGRYADAAEEWRRAAEQKPRDLRLRQELAVTLRLSQDLAGAQAVLEQIVAEREDAAGARYLLGDVLVARQQPEAAIPHLERAVALDPSLAHAHAVLGRAYALVGRAPAAVPHLEKALAVDDDGSLHLQLARAYRAAGRDADAQRTLAEWERLRKSRAEAQAPGAPPPLTPP
jgi:tetratricopeptide (TPR) repeat protein